MTARRRWWPLGRRPGSDGRRAVAHVQRPTPLAEHYARNRERAATSKEEWASRQPYPPFLVADAEAARRWADQLVAGTPVADQPLTRGTSAAWAAALGIELTYIGFVASEIVQRAIGAGLVVAPEPGKLVIGFATRDRETERETHLGWCFLPDSSEWLVVAANGHVPIDGLAGGEDVTGGTAAATLLELAARSMDDVRQGPSEVRLRQPR